MRITSKVHVVGAAEGKSEGKVKECGHGMEHRTNLNSLPSKEEHVSHQTFNSLIDDQETNRDESRDEVHDSIEPKISHQDPSRLNPNHFPFKPLFNVTEPMVAENNNDAKYASVDDDVF